MRKRKALWFPQPREQVGRTVLVYIVGDNGVK